MGAWIVKIPLCVVRCQMENGSGVVVEGGGGQKKVIKHIEFGGKKVKQN